MTHSDKTLLTDLVLKYSNTLENKKTDTVSSSMKAKCWQDLADEFNAFAACGTQRDVSQLKHVRCCLLRTPFA